MNNMSIFEEKYEKYISISKEIDNCLSNIEKDTGMLSFNEYHKHNDYKKLLNMGDRIIPYLIYYATQRDGFSWIILSLLGDLSKENPIPKEHYGRFYHQISDWMLWYINSKYINTDIYHGLVD